MQRRYQWRILWYFFRPFRLRLVGLMVLGLVYTFFEIAILAAVYPLIIALLNRKSSAGGGQVLGGVTDLVGALPGDPFVVVVVIFGLAYLVAQVLGFLRDYVSFALGQRVREYYQDRVYEKVLLSDAEFMMEQKQGQLMNTIITCPAYMAIAFARVPVIATEVIKMAVVLAFLVAVSPLATGVFLVLGLLYMGSIRLVSRVVTSAHAHDIARLTEETNVLVNESLNGFQQLRVYQGERSWIRRFAAVMREMCVKTNRMTLFNLMPGPLVNVLIILAMCGSLLGIKAWAPDSLESMLPLIGVYFMAVLRLLPGVSTISADWLQMVGRLPYAQSLYDALVQDTYRLPPGRVTVDHVGPIRFEDVAYRYPSRDVPALAAVSFAIEPMRMTAVVGESGSGKSTVATLLVRSIMPSGGRITVDGVALADIRPESWLAKIAYVSQEAFIFNASVRDNIRFGGEFSDEAVVRAAGMADAHGFIAAMPQGYDTPVGDRGVKLSGGQRQRLALARAILRNPELLILDEATSALDNVAEQEVQHAIDSLSRTHTVLVIAHRLNTIKDADRIVVLKGGRAVETGAHDELLAMGGEYARLYRRESNTDGEAGGAPATGPFGSGR